MTFYIDTTDQTGGNLIVSTTDTSRVSLQALVGTDTELPITLKPVTVTAEDTTTADFSSSDTFEVFVGHPDRAPNGGTWKVLLGSSTTAVLDYNVKTKDLETELTALFRAEGKSAVTVTRIADGVWRVNATTDGAIVADSVSIDSDGLVPTSSNDVMEADLGSATSPFCLVLSIRQSPLAYSTPTTSVTNGRSGTLNLNTVEMWEYSQRQPQESFVVPFFIRRERTSGENRTIYGPVDLTVYKGSLDPATATPTPIPGGNSGNAVLYTAQTPTEDEQRQARENIGLAVGRAPSEIENCEMWFDASAIDATDGSLLTLWVDSSGNSYTATLRNGAPIYRSNVLGGKPGILFADAAEATIGGDLITAAGTLDSLFDQDLTVIVLSTYSDGEQGAYFGATGAGGTTGSGVSSGFFFGLRGGQISQFYTGGTTPGNIAKANAQPAGTPQCDVYRYNGASITSRNNRQTLVPDAATGDIGFISTGRFCIGSAGSNIGTGWDHRGYIFEIAVFSRALNDDEVRSVEQYFREKYLILDKPRMLFVGDSIWRGNASGVTTQPPQLAMESLSNGYQFDVASLCHEGDSVLANGSEYSTAIGADIMSGDDITLDFELGVNDLVAGTAAALMWSRVKLWGMGRKKVGVTRLLIHTLSPVDPALYNVDAVRLDFNSTVRSDYADAGASGVVDIAGNSAIGDKEDTYNGSQGVHPSTYYVDGLHPNDAGNVVWAGIMEDAIRDLAIVGAITVSSESSDTTCFPIFVTAATGDLGPKTNAGFTFNSSTGTVTATAFAGTIVDSNGNEQIKFSTTASAINEITVTNATISNRPTISATGGDTNISLAITGKGTGSVYLSNGAIDVSSTLITLNANLDATGVSVTANTATFTGALTLGNGSNATQTIASNLSGATDPTLTFANALITASGGFAAGTVAIGGATIGSNAFAATGTGFISGTFTLGDGTAATAILASNLSGATDPTITFANAAINFSSPIGASAGAAGTPSLSFSGDPNTGFFSRAGDFISIAYGGTERMTFGYTGGGGPTAFGILVASDCPIGWNSGTATSAGGYDLFLFRDAAATLRLGGNVNGSPVPQTIKAHDGITGTDIAGASLAVAGGKGTGAGRGGAIIEQTSLSVGTGTTVQSYGTRRYQSAKFYDITASASAETFCSITLASGKYLGMRMVCTVFCSDGTDHQALTSALTIDAVNKGGTITAQIVQNDGTVATSSGTLNPVTYSVVDGTNNLLVKVAVTSSLSETVRRVKWSIVALNSDDAATVTPQ